MGKKGTNQNPIDVNLGMEFTVGGKKLRLDLEGKGNGQSAPSWRTPNKTQAEANENRFAADIARLEEQQKQEESLGVMENTGRFLASTLNQTGAMIEDVIGFALDLSDDPVKNVFGENNLYSKHIIDPIDKLIGSQRASEVRKMDQIYNKLKTGNETVDYVGNVGASIGGSILGVYLTGGVGTRALAGVGLKGKALQFANAALMTGGTASTIGLEVEENVYRGTLDKYNPGLKNHAKAAGNKAYEDYIKEHGEAGLITSGGAEKARLDAEKAVYDNYAASNEAAAKVAKAAGEKGRYTAMAAMAPSLFLNLGTAGLFTKGQGITRNIIDKPSRIGFKAMGTEALQEGIEEGLMEGYSKDIGEKIGLTGKYTMSDAMKKFLDKRTWEEAIIGGVAGGLTAGAINLGTYNNRAKAYEQQQQTIQKWKDIAGATSNRDLISEFTDVTRSLEEVAELAKKQQELFEAGDVVGAQAIGNRALGIQAYQAFQTGTSEELVKAYEALATSEELSVEERARAADAVSSIKQMENIYLKANRKYRNSSEVFTNRVNDLMLDKGLTKIRSEIELKKLEANKAIRQALDVGELNLFGYTQERNVEGNDKVLSLKEIPSTKELSYDMKDLFSPETDYVGSNKKIWEEFRSKANEYTSVQELEELFEQERNMMSQIVNNNKMYNQLTSKNTQKQMKEMDRLQKGLEQNASYLNEIKGTEQYESFVEEYVDQFKNIDEIGRLSVKLRLLQENEQYKVAQKLQKQKAIDAEMSPQDTSGKTTTPTIESNNAVNKEKAVGNNVKKETKDNSSTEVTPTVGRGEINSNVNINKVVNTKNPFEELPEPIDPFEGNNPVVLPDDNGKPTPPPTNDGDDKSNEEKQRIANEMESLLSSQELIDDFDLFGSDMSNMDIDIDDLSFDPAEVNDNLGKEEKSKIKSLVQDYVNLMKEDLDGQIPSFESFLRDYITKGSMQNADRFFNVFKLGWELNGFPKADFDQVYKNIFRSKEAVANEMNTMFESFVKGGKEKTTQNQKEEIDNLNGKSQEELDKGKPKEVDGEGNVRFERLTFTSEDSRPKLAYSSIKSQKTTTVEDDSVVVDYEYVEEGLNYNAIVDPRSLLDPDKYLPGTKLTIVIPEGRQLNGIVIPVYETNEKSPLYGTKIGTETYGAFFNRKVKENPNFTQTQEYLDTLPMFIQNEEGVNVAQVHEPGWYEPSQFTGDIKEARSNIRSVRRNAYNAAKNGKSSQIVITEKRGGTFVTTKENEPLLDISETSPESQLGVVDPRSKSIIIDGKPFKGELANNPDFITEYGYKAVELRKVAVKNGKDVYMAFPIFHKQLNESEIDTVYRVLDAFINRKKKPKTSDQIQLEKAGVSLNSFEQVESFLKTFVRLTNLRNTKPSPESYAKQFSNRFQEGTPVLMTAKGGLVFGVTGGQVMMISPSDAGTAKGIEAMKFLRDEVLPKFILNGSMNSSSVKMFDVNGNLTETHSSYSEFLKERSQTNVKTFDIGTEGSPKKVTLVQPVIHYDMAEALSRKTGMGAVNEVDKKNQLTLGEQKPTTTPTEQKENVPETPVVVETPTPLPLSDGTQVETETVEEGSELTEDELSILEMGQLVPELEDASLAEAVLAAEATGEFEFTGDTVEQKTEDAKKLLSENTTESKEFFEKHVKISVDQVNESNIDVYLQQMENQISWVNEYDDDFSLDPIALSDEDVMELAKEISKIPGLSPSHQSQIVDYMFNKISEKVKFDSGSTIEKSAVISELRTQANNLLNSQLNFNNIKISELKTLLPNQKVERVIKKFELANEKINLVKSNMDILLQSSFEKISKYTGISTTQVNKEEDLEGDDVIEDENNEKEKNFSVTALQENGKDASSYRLRRFMSGIMAIDGRTKAVRRGAMGVPSYIPFDEAWDTTQALLSDVPLDFEVMIGVLESNVEAYPWITQLVEKLKNADSVIQKEFVHNMGKHALKMEFVMYSYDRKTNSMVLKVYNTNSSALSMKLKNRWNTNLLNNSPLVNGEGGTYTLNSEVAEEMLEQYDSWFNTKRLKQNQERVLLPAIEKALASGKDNIKFTDTRLKLFKKQDFDVPFIVDTKEGQVSITISRKGEIKINPSTKNNVGQAIVGFSKMSLEDQNSAIKELQEWLNKFGIELSNGTVREIFNEGMFIKGKQLPATVLFKESAASEGAFGLLGNWLREVKNGNVGQDLEDELNNPLRQGAIEKHLTKLESKYSQGLVTNSFRDGKKSIYGFTASKMITDRVKELKSEEYRKKLRQISFSSESFWLDVLDEPTTQDVFEITHLGLTAVKEYGRENTDKNGITNLADSDHELTKLGFFQDTKLGSTKNTFGQSNIPMRVVKFLFPTMSDKTTMMVVQTLSLDLRKHTFMTQVNGQNRLSVDTTNMLISQLVNPELKRIINFRKHVGKTNIKAYDKGATKFLMLPQLNNLEITLSSGAKVTLSELLNNTASADLTYDKVMQLARPEIEKALYSYVSTLVNEKIDSWKKSGIVEDNDGKTKLNMDKAYLDGIDAQGGDKVLVAAFDFVFNNLISNANSFQTVIGDPAIYYKSKSSDSVKQSQDTFINVGKRLAAMIAPGNKIAGSDNESYIQIFLNDHVDISENIEYLSELLDGKKFSREEYARLLKEDKLLAKQYLNQFPNSGAYLEIEGTDAQEYTTWQEHLHILENMGRLGDSAYDITAEEIREAKEMFANETPIDKMSAKQKAILKKVLQPMKPVYTGQMFDSDQDVMRMMYIKSSSFPLLPQLTKGLELDKLRQKMESMQETSGKKVRASYQTANKVGANSNALTLFNPDGTIRDTITDSELQESSLVLDRKNFRIQLDVPYKSYKKNKDTVSMGTQLMKLLFGNGVTDLDGFVFEGKTMNGRDLLNEFNSTYSEIIDSMKNNLYQELGLDANGRMINPRETGKRVQKLLIEEAKSRGYSKQDLDSLKLQMKTKDGKVVDYDFAIPIWMSPNSNRFESLLNAIVTNRIVKLKFPGASYVAGSEAGFKLQSTFEGIQENKIVFTDSWEGELKAARVENGVFKPAQIIAPSKFRDNDGNLIDLLKKKNGQYVYVEKTEKGFKLKSDMISKELLRITSFRTPTSGHLSASELEIVGFVPQEVGDLMIVPRNLTTQKGLDFDIDKETTYQYWHRLDEDGKIKRYDDTNIDELRKEHINLLDKINKKKASREDFKRAKELNKFFEKHNINKLIEIYKSVLTNPSDDMQSKINQVLSIDFAKEQASLIDGIVNSTKDNTWFTPMSDEYQKQKMALGSAGKVGTGAYSLDVTFHSLSEQLEDKLQMTTVIFEKGEPKRVTKSYTIGEYHSDGKLGNSRTLDNSRSISEVLSERQNIATDNEKEQVMGRVNLNGHTLDADKIMSMLGFDKGEDGNSIAFLLLSQPIIKRYVELLENGSSNLAGYNANLEDEIFEQLAKEFNIPLAALTDYENYASLSGHFLTNKAMLSNLTNTSPEIQAAAIASFLNFRDDGIKIRKIQTTLNVDSKGLGKSTLEVISKEDQLVDLLENEDIENLDGLIGDVIRRTDVLTKDGIVHLIKNEGYIYLPNIQVLVKPTTPSAKFAFTAVGAAKRLWRKHFPYDSPTFRSILGNLDDIIGEKGEVSDYRIQERTQLILKEYKKFINSYAANSFYTNEINDSENIKAERRRLFLDIEGNQSLASFLLSAIKDNPRLKNNKLIKKFEYEINKKGDGPSIIKFNNTATGNFDEEYLNNAIIELFDANYPVGIWNGKPYTSRMLAQDLVTYSLLEGGVQEAIQFIKYVPVSYLEKMNVPFVYHKFSDSVSDSLVKTFVSQFRSLNAYLHESMYPKQNESFFDKFKETIKAAVDGDIVTIPRTEVDKFLEKTNITIKKTPTHYSIRMKGGDVVLITARILKEGDLELKIQKKKQFHGMTTYGSYPIVQQVVREASNVSSEKTNVSSSLEEGSVSTTGVEKTNSFPLASELKLGESIDQTLDVISQDPEYNKLAKALAKVLRVTGTQPKVELVKGKGFRGRYSASRNVIQINENIAPDLSKKELSRVILKESVHAVMDRELLKYADVNGNLKTSNAPEPILNLVKLFNQVKRLPEFQSEIDAIRVAISNEKGLTADQKQIYYGAYNLKEFVEMIMTQPEFQQKLGKITASDGVTLFDKFKQFLSQILELAGVTFDSGSVTEAAISSVFESMAQRVKPSVETKPIINNPSSEIEKSNSSDQNLDNAGKIVKSLDGDNSPIKKYELFPGVYANKEQTEAIDKMDSFLAEKNSQPSVFVLEGRGGTGKTTIAKKLIEKAKAKRMRIVALAPTHVARGILVNSIGNALLSGNGTVAGAIGLKPQGADKFVRDPRWKPSMSKIAGANILVIDECSMISKEHLNEIMKVAREVNPRVKIIFMGDNVQLEPVGSDVESPTFSANTNSNYKAKLVERMRQGEDSPIVPITDLFANNIESERPVLDPIPKSQRVSRSTDKGEVLFPESEAENKKSFTDDFKKNPYSTKVIAYRNATLKYWNNLARSIIFGNNANDIMPGDLMVAKTSLGELDPVISNSEFFLVEKVTPLGTKNFNVGGVNYPLNMYNLIVKIDRGDKTVTKIIDVPGISPSDKMQVKNIKDALIKRAKQNRREWVNYYSFINNSLDYEYGYAITSHKSQGATFDNVYVIEDDINSVNAATVLNRNKAKYVASSRPKKKLVMYSKKNGQQNAGLNLTEEYKGNTGTVQSGKVPTPPPITDGGFDIASELEYQSSLGGDLDMAAEMMKEMESLNMDSFQAEFSEMSNYQVELPVMDDFAALQKEAKLAAKQKENRKNNLSLDPEYIIDSLLQKGIINGKCK